MPSRFDQQFDGAAAHQLDQTFGVSVQLRRGTALSSAFTCSFDEVQDEVLLEEAFGNQVQRRIWYILATDAVIDGRTVIPRVGDYVVEVATGFRFEILPEGEDRAASLLPGEKRYRVLTKRAA